MTSKEILLTLVVGYLILVSSILGRNRRVSLIPDDCGRVLFGSRVAKREAEGTVHTKHQLNLDPNPEGT